LSFVYLFLCWLIATSLGIAAIVASTERPSSDSRASPSAEFSADAEITASIERLKPADPRG
jgi:hypothetical protein